MKERRKKDLTHSYGERKEKRLKQKKKNRPWWQPSASGFEEKCRMEASLIQKSHVCIWPPLLSASFYLDKWLKRKVCSCCGTIYDDMIQKDNGGVIDLFSAQLNK